MSRPTEAELRRRIPSARYVVDAVRAAAIEAADAIESPPLACFGTDPLTLRDGVAPGGDAWDPTRPGGPLGWLRDVLLDVDHSEANVGDGPSYGDDGSIVSDDRPCFERTRAILRAVIARARSAMD